MIATSVPLGKYQLMLMAHINEQGDAKLTQISWLATGQPWHHAKSSPKLKQHHNLGDDDVVFIDRDSLSNDKADHAVLLDSIAQIEDYAHGKRTTFDLPLDMSFGTPFQQQVWRALQSIPFGAAISYATLAKRVNNPKGYRAVAQANSKNPFSIIVPCHRVIASDGKLGGYTGGLDKKAYLLALEAVTYKK